MWDDKCDPQRGGKNPDELEHVANIVGEATEWAYADVHMRQMSFMQLYVWIHMQIR